MNNAIGWICAVLIVLIVASCTAHRDIKGTLFDGGAQVSADNV